MCSVPPSPRYSWPSPRMWSGISLYSGPPPCHSSRRSPPTGPCSCGCGLFADSSHLCSINFAGYRGGDDGDIDGRQAENTPSDACYARERGREAGAGSAGCNWTCSAGEALMRRTFQQPDRTAGTRAMAKMHTSAALLNMAPHGCLRAAPGPSSLSSLAAWRCASESTIFGWNPERTVLATPSP